MTDTTPTEDRAATRKEIDRLFDDAVYLREAHLRDTGWQQSSDYPDCVWRWSKTVKGGRMTCSAEEALRVQDALADHGGEDDDG